MPYALKEAGFYGGMLLIFVVAYCADYTVRMIVRLGQKAKRKYYEDLCASQFGKPGYNFVVGAMGIFSYGAAVAYLIGIGAWGRGREGGREGGPREGGGAAVQLPRCGYPGEMRALPGEDGRAGKSDHPCICPPSPPTLTHPPPPLPLPLQATTWPSWWRRAPARTCTPTLG
jgi:hypothetical protein